jgi:tetratricopeptide (TPR) repeat protein
MFPVSLWKESVTLKHGEKQQDSLDKILASQEKLLLAVTNYPDMQSKVSQQQLGRSVAGVQESTYDELAKQLGIDPKLLREKLPQFARELKRAPNATTYERACAAYVTKDYAEAERLALIAADEAQKKTPLKPADVIKALILAGYSARDRIEYADALRYFRSAEKLIDRTHDPLQWADVQSKIAFVLAKDGRYASAEAKLWDVLKIYDKVLKPEHPASLGVRNSLAVALRLQGKYAEAEAELREVLKLQVKVLGPEHPDTLGSRSNLATALNVQGKYAEAEAELREALKLQVKVLGPEHPDTLASRSNLATALYLQGKYAEAEAELREVLKLKVKVLGPEHPDTLKVP